MRPLNAALLFCVGMQRVVVLPALSGLLADSSLEILIIGEAMNAPYN